MFQRILNAVREDPLQCLAALLSMAGAQLLSDVGTLAPWGWVLFLISNMVFIIWGLKKSMLPIVLMQSYFMTTSVKGIMNYLL